MVHEIPVVRTLLGVGFTELSNADRDYLTASAEALIGHSGDVILLLEPSRGLDGTITEIGTYESGEPFQRTWTYHDDV